MLLISVRARAQLVLGSSSSAGPRELRAEAGHAPWGVLGRKPDVLRQARRLGRQRAPGSQVAATLERGGGGEGREHLLGTRRLSEARGESGEESARLYSVMLSSFIFVHLASGMFSCSLETIC